MKLHYPGNALARYRDQTAVKVSNIYPDGAAMAAHLETVERKRGKPGADRLRVDLRKAWKEQQGKP